MKKTIILFFIILLAFFLRVYALSEVPAGLDSDESEFAFNAYTISKYLRSENNEFLPYQVNTYGNYRPLGLAYFIAGSLKIFGNNIFAVRFPTVVFGTLAVLVMFLIVKIISSKNFLGLIAAFLIAINPWHVFFSRGSAEQILSLNTLLLMIIFLIKFNRCQKIRYLVLLYLFAVLSFFTYSGIVLIIFLFSGVVMIFEFVKHKKIMLAQFLPFILFIIFPVLPILLHNPGFLNGRMKQISVFYGQGKEGVKLVTEEQIRENGIYRDSYQNFVTRIFHNVPFNTYRVIIDNWTKHLSFEFLYLASGPPKRLQVPSVGNFLLIESIFVFCGLLLMFRQGKFRLFFLSLGFILFSFLPAGLTVQEIPSTSRTIFSLVGFFLVEGYFLWQLTKHKSKIIVKILVFVIILIMTFQFIDYLHNYLILQPRHQNWYRKPEMQEEAYLIKNNFSKYEEIYVAKNEAEPIYYYYFFNNLDPISILKNKTKKNLGDWSDGKIHFIHDQCVHAINNNKNNLLIENSACESGGKIIKYIYGSDGRKALVVKQTKYKKINEN